MTRVHIAGCVYMDHGGFSEPLGSVCGRVCGERGADAETPSMGEGGSIPVFFERGFSRHPTLKAVGFLVYAEVQP